MNVPPAFCAPLTMADTSDADPCPEASVGDPCSDTRPTCIWRPSPQAPSMAPPEQEAGLVENAKVDSDTPDATRKPEQPEDRSEAQTEQRVEGSKPAAAPVPMRRPAKDRRTGRKAERGIPASVPRARMRFRHASAILLFIILVVGSTAFAAWYMYTQAKDRYVSTVAFSIRSETYTSPFEMFAGVGTLPSPIGSDADILYDFITSQSLVARVNSQLDLAEIWSFDDPEIDPLFAFLANGTIEDLTDYWNRRVNVYSDSAIGLVNIEVEAFTPEDARAIAEAIYDESSEMINHLSAAAEQAAIQTARIELEAAEARLRDVREAMTLFRNRTQIVDPEATIQAQMGLLGSLQTQLAEQLIELDILRQGTSPGDPRIRQLELRVEVIEARIEEERRKLGLGNGSGTDGTVAEMEAFADLVGEYERLAVDLELAQTAYASAIASFEAAQSEARRQKRFLAAHIEPTLAESATKPDRLTVVFLVALISFIVWSIVVLVGYSLKDRR